MSHFKSQFYKKLNDRKLAKKFFVAKKYLLKLGEIIWEEFQIFLKELEKVKKGKMLLRKKKRGST